MNLWEISIKYALGKLDLGGLEPEDLAEKAFQAGIRIVELNHFLLASYHRLPRHDNHKDPFDRLLIWQAIFE